MFTKTRRPASSVVSEGGLGRLRSSRFRNSSASESENSTFEGNAPGFTLGLGGEIPLNVLNLSLGADFGYLYLNFTNIAWYNAQDEEIIVTYTGDQDGRVDLDLSGFRGKVELKRYFAF